MVIWSARRQSPVALRAGCTCPGIVSERPAPPGSRAGRRRPSPGYAGPWRGESRSPGRGQSPGFAHSRMPPSHGPPMCASSPAIFNCRLMPDWSPSSRLKARPSAGSARRVHLAAEHRHHLQHDVRLGRAGLIAQLAEDRQIPFEQRAGCRGVALIDRQDGQAIAGSGPRAAHRHGFWGGGSEGVPPPIGVQQRRQPAPPLAEALPERGASS